MTFIGCVFVTLNAPLESDDPFEVQNLRPHVKTAQTATAGKISFWAEMEFYRHTHQLTYFFLLCGKCKNQSLCVIECLAS